MANEITIVSSIALASGTVKASRATSYKASQASARYDSGSQTIGTTQEAIVFKSDIATLGHAIFINNDPTNYVEIGAYISSTFYPIAKIGPGEDARFRISSTALYAKANTAPVDLEFLAFAA